MIEIIKIEITHEKYMVKEINYTILIDKLTKL